MANNNYNEVPSLLETEVSPEAEDIKDFPEANVSMEVEGYQNDITAAVIQGHQRCKDGKIYQVEKLIKNNQGLYVCNSYGSDDLLNHTAMSQSLTRRRGCFSESELDNEIYHHIPTHVEPSSDTESKSIDSDDHSRQITCLSDKITDRGNWSSYQYSTTISALESGCKLCYKKECVGCRYFLQYGRNRLSTGVQLKHWLSVPNIRKRNQQVGKKMMVYVKAPITDEPDVKKKFTRSQISTLVCISIANFALSLSMSIIAPFFPKEAANKGMRSAVSGFVFSIYALVMMIASPIFGKLLPYTGTNFMYLSGVFVSGASNILFGVLDKIKDETMFAVFCFVVRFFEALGAAAFSIASYTIILDLFPDDISMVFGLVETSVGVGFSIGPAIGGGLYSIAGYGFPFFILGAIVLANIPLSWCMLGNSTVMNSTAMDASYKDLISVPLVITLSIVIVVSSQAQGFIDPTLEPHLRQYNVGPEIVGLLFLVTAAAYALFSPVVSYIISRWETKYPMMILGLLVMTLSLLLLGPSPFLPFTGAELWLNIFAIALLGASFALAFIPTFEAMLNSAIDAGMEDNMGTYCLVSGLWNSMCSLGEVLGPTLGGVLSDFLDFPLSSTIMAICSLATAIIVLIVWLLFEKRVPKDHDIEEDATKNLIQSENSLLVDSEIDLYYQRLQTQRHIGNLPVST